MAQPGFWRDLPKLEDGFKILKMAKELGYRPMILSRGPRRQCSAWSEKLEWCRRHLPDIAVTLTEDKGLVYGAVLVDDWPPYIERWLTWRQRGLVIMPSREWNLGFSHPQVKRYVMGRTDKEVQHALQIRMKLHRSATYDKLEEDHKPSGCRIWTVAVCGLPPLRSPSSCWHSGGYLERRPAGLSRAS